MLFEERLGRAIAFASIPDTKNLPSFFVLRKFVAGVLTNPRWTLKKFEDSPAVFVSRGWAGFGGIGKVEIDNCYTRCPADLRPLSACSAVKIH